MSFLRSAPGTGSPTLKAPGVQTRVSLVLLATAGLFLATLLGVQWAQERQITALFHERQAEAGHAFQRIVASRSRLPAVHCDDYARWDDFVSFVKKPDPAWKEVNLIGGIPTFGLDVAWVLDDKLKLIATAIPEDDASLAPLPVPQRLLTDSLRTGPTRHFFVHDERGLLEVWSQSIVPSADLERSTPPRGYYVVAKRWSRAWIADLARSSDGVVKVLAQTDITSPRDESLNSGRIASSSALTGIDGQAVATLEYSAPYSAARQALAALHLSSLLAMFGALLSVVVVWLAMSHWVGRPLATVSDALRSETPEQLGSIGRRHDELGEVARLVTSFFTQRERLVAARREAEAAVVAKSNFLANISHELRTPMHGILSFSRFGLRDSKTATREDLHDNFQQINSCGESLLGLLNALLDLSKFNAGRMPFAFSEVDVADLVDVAVDEFRSYYRERELALEVEIPGGLPTVVADRTRVLQVLRNVLSNAAKFTPAHGTVRVIASAHGDLQRIAVEDSGVGIPKGEEEKIFDKFAQASHTSPRTGGTGLGLAICREIVKAHEGRIWAENRETGGTRVVFELPTAGPSIAHVEPATDESLPADGNSPPHPSTSPSSASGGLWKRAS